MRKVVWSKWYSPPIRIVTHLVFWLIVSIFHYLIFLRSGGEYIKLLIIKELIISIILFYSANWLITVWMSKRNVFPIILFFMFSYCCWITLTYITCFSIKDEVPVSDERIYMYVKFVTDNGYLGIYHSRKLPSFLPDFLLLISIPLTPKMVIFLLKSANRILILETDKLTLELENAKLEQEKRKMEFQILKLQISPHFLFNTLNSIYRLSEKKIETTFDTIRQLSNMLQYILYQTNGDKIHIRKEIHFLQDYLNLVRIRFGQRLKLNYDMMEINEPYKIVPLILLPFIENAIKHGPDRSGINAWVNLSLNVDKGVLNFEVSNGVNRNCKKIIVGGIGLQNAKSRLELWYSGRYTLDIFEGSTSYCVILKIQL